MNAEDVLELVAIGHEHLNIEFKGPGASADGPFFGRVLRAVLAMANTRDGGKVLVGINERSRVIEGLSPEQLESWRAFDQIRQRVNRYADPFVDFDIELVEVDGATVVVVDVAEFNEIPVLCKRDGAQDSNNKKIVRQGACYVRGRTQGIESLEIPTHVEMRELLELATSKRLRSFLGQAHAAGLTVARSEPDQYGAERDELSGALVDSIREGSYWLIAIHPADYQAERIAEFARLEQIARAQTVRSRFGYSEFPWLPFDTQLARGDRFVESVHDIGSFRGVWRLYQSGQFVSVKSVLEVTRNDLERTTTRADTGMYMLDIVSTYMQAYEFAARLAHTDAGGDPMVVEIRAFGLSGRVLVEPTDWFAWRRPTVAFRDWKRPATRVSQQELVANARALALRDAHELIRRFAPTFTDEAVRKLGALAMP